jgi:hypothetical protein
MTNLIFCLSKYFKCDFPGYEQAQTLFIHILTDGLAKRYRFLYVIKQFGILNGNKGPVSEFLASFYYVLLARQSNYLKICNSPLAIKNLSLLLQTCKKMIA